MGLSGTEGEVAVGGLDVEVSDKGGLAIILGVDEVGVGENGDLAVLVLDDSSEGGGLLLGEVLEAVGDVEADVRADAGLGGDGLLAEAEVGNKGLWL